MRPDDRTSPFDDLGDPGMDLPFDADLESLHAELAGAGQHARRVLYGRTQPTRLFSNQLRSFLIGEGSAGSTSFGGSGSRAGTSGASASAARPASASAAGSPSASAAAPASASMAGAVAMELGRAGARERLRDIAADRDAPDRGDEHHRRPGLALPEPRNLLALLAIAGMAAVLALGAVSGTFGPPLP